MIGFFIGLAVGFVVAFFWTRWSRDIQDFDELTLDTEDDELTEPTIEQLKEDGRDPYKVIFRRGDE